nr:unnamed protein product [Digitaria exilis]
MFQQDLIMNLLSSLQQNEKVDGSETGISSQIRSLESDKAAETASSEKERSLLVKISELQSRYAHFTEVLLQKITLLNKTARITYICNSI